MIYDDGKLQGPDLDQPDEEEEPYEPAYFGEFPRKAVDDDV